MKTIDLYLYGDNQVIDFEMEHFSEGITLRLYNDESDPAEQIFFNLPELNSGMQLRWLSKLRYDGPISDLTILLKNSTHIENGDYHGFENVLFSDHRILEKTQHGVILDEENHLDDIRLTIDKFKAKSGYIFCSHLNLLKGCVVEKLLAIKSSIAQPEVNFLLSEGGYKEFTINKLEFNSTLKKLTLEHAYIKQNFEHRGIDEFSMINCKLIQNMILDKVKNVKNLSLQTEGTVIKINSGYATITNLVGQRGKFYISSHSYIDFKLTTDGHLSGIDLVLDMQNGNGFQKKITFPAQKFHFETIKILGSNEVTIPAGGACRNLIIIDCQKLVARDVIAAEISYKLLAHRHGEIELNSVKSDLISVSGIIQAIFRDIQSRIIEGEGLCNITIGGNAEIFVIRNNLNLDERNRDYSISNNKAVIYLENSDKDKIIIHQILAKLSTFHVKGNVQLGNVVIQTIDKLPTLLWVQIANNSHLKINSLLVSHDHGFSINKQTGEIIVHKSNNMITGGDVNASVASATINDWLFVKAGSSIRFDGKIHVTNGDFGLFAERGDISINGSTCAANSLVLSAERGKIFSNADLSSTSIIMYSKGQTYLYSKSLVATEKLLIHSLESFIQITESDLKSPHIVLIGTGNVNIYSSIISSGALIINSGQSTNIIDSQIITGSLFVRSVCDFMLAKSGIDLKQHRYSLFASHQDGNLWSTMGGLNIATGVTVVGVFSNDTSKVRSSLSWQVIDYAKDIELRRGCAYIDANKGYISGSSIDAKENVIIRTKESLEIVPIVLYNEAINAGGFNEKSIREVASRINAGLIDIDAGKSAIFVGSLLNAAIGKVRAESLILLDSPEEIRLQQERVNILKHWGIKNEDNINHGKIKVGKYFSFQQSTSISQRIGNLTVYDDYVSPELSFTQEGGNLVIDRSITRYEKLHLNAKDGKLLIISKSLQSIYTNHGGREEGKNTGDNNRIVIGGDYVYLSADDLIIQGAKIKVVNDLKIITKHGVEILPVSAHERLMYHMGSKTRVEEHIVRQIISEINAGYLDIKAGGAIKAVSALIAATGVKIDAESLELGGEKEIFEKQVHFHGRKKWHGGRQSWNDFTHDEFVLPTVIHAQDLRIEITGDTTVKAANILASGDSFIKSGGDIKFMPMYNIHLHDHVSKKSHLFKFDGASLKVNSTKTVREYYHGQAPVPTIYYSGGEFYGYSDGKIHLLGAKLIGNDIYLAAKKGIKIEACPFSEEEFIAVNESGMRVGFNSGNGSHSVSANLFENLSSAQYKRTLYEASEIIARNNLVISTEGALEIISSKMQFDKACIKVRDLKVSTAKEETSVQTNESSKEAGLHAGIKEGASGTVQRIGDLASKKGTHWLDLLDRSLKIYGITGDALGIIHDMEILAQTKGPLLADDIDGKANMKKLQELQMIKAGKWIGASVSNSGTNQTLNKAIDNVFRGGDLQIIASNAADIEGIDCVVDNFKLKSKSLNVQASADQCAAETYSSEFSLTIPIKENIPLEASMSNMRASSSQTNFHPDNKIQAFGTMEIEVDENGKISGVKLQADKVYIRAKNLILESLQDVLEERMQNMNVGFNIGKKSTSFQAVAGGQSRDAAWTNAIGCIIGNELVNIAVQQTLEIAGGLIVNAELGTDGNLTDQGKLQVTAGNIITRKLHDYDNGKSYGVGVSLSSHLNNEGDKEYGLGMPIKYGFNEQSRDILPTISKGCLAIINEDKATQLSDINCNLGGHIGRSKGSKANLDATLPASDFLWAESNNFQKLCDYLTASQITGVPAGDAASEGDEQTENKGKELTKEELLAALSEELPADADFDLQEKITMALVEQDDADIPVDKFADAANMAYRLYQFYLDQKLGVGFNPEIALNAALNVTKGLLGGSVPQADSVLVISDFQDIEVLKRIQSKVKDKYENLPPDLEQKIISVAYQLTKAYQERPELKQVQYATAIPIVPLPIFPYGNDFSQENPSNEDQALFAANNVIEDLLSIPKEVEQKFMQIGINVCAKIVINLLDRNSEDGVELKDFNSDREATLERHHASKKSTVAVKILATTSDDHGESGICKVAHPYSPDDEVFSTKEDWMLNKGLSGKYKELLQGVHLYGLNPVDVKDYGDYIKVHTELPGGETAARKCFKNLTGFEAPSILIDGIQIFNKPNGDYVILRSPEKSRSGHWKVDNNVKKSAGVVGVDEKMTFKELF